MPAPAAPARLRDRGSALMLLPACVLVVLVLISIAVDMSLVHLRQRQAVDLAAAAANDAVTAGADDGQLRSGTYVLDPAQVAAVVERRIAASGLADDGAVTRRVVVEDDTVEVTLTVDVPYVFTGIMPGTPRRTQVTARASATAHEL